MNVIHSNVAGLDVLKMQVTASVLQARAGQHPQLKSAQFSALPQGLAQLTDWLSQFRVTDAAMVATGIYWLNVLNVLETVRHSAAGLQRSVRQADQGT